MAEYNRANYQECKKSKLLQFAKDYGIHITGKPSKQQLIALLDNHHKSQSKENQDAQPSTKQVGYQLQPISPEQQNAATHFAQGENIILNAVAGSGKTTFVLHLARQLPERKFLLLTYNKKLSDETKEKCAKLDIKNVIVYTFHACATRLYSCLIHTDTKLRECRIEQKLKKKLDIDAIIIDEAQDMIPEFYYFARTVIASFAKHPQMCIIGDIYQTIYEFKEADKRFIELAPDIYNLPFTQCELSTSYRCTIENARFVNALIGRERIKSNRHGPKPLLVSVNDIFDYRAINAIVALIRDKANTYGKDGVFILAPSVKIGTHHKAHKRGSPISAILNMLSKSGTDVFVQSDDDAELSKREINSMQNKISIVTYHKSKGLERECAIVFAFDNKYFEYYDKESDPTRIANAQYVAITRAKQELIIIQQSGHALPFLRDAIDCCEQRTIDGEKMLETYIPIVRKPPIQRVRCPTELLRFVPSDIIIEAIKLLDCKEIQPESDHIEINLSTPSRNGNTEEVSDITGTMIMLNHARQCNVISDIKQPSSLLHQFKWNWNFDTPENACKSAACLNAMHSGFEHKLYQIEKWDWVPAQVFAQLTQRLSQTLGTVGVAERYCEKSGRFPLHGYIDWTTRDTLYEIKCTSSLTEIHILQLAIYAYMAHGDYKRFILYNARTQQMIEIPRHPLEIFEKVVELLWRDRAIKQSSNEVFIKTMRDFAPSQMN